MDIQGKSVLVLGGYGLVGMAVCRALLPHRPKRLVVASLRREEAEQAVFRLQSEFPDSPTQILPAWGDVFLRTEWQRKDAHPRPAVLANPQTRRRLVNDILDELDEDILTSSLLYQLITGQWGDLGGEPADIVIDCMNTATAVAYQDVYSTARDLKAKIDAPDGVDWHEEVERLLASLYIPQLVRHMQILYEALRRAGSQAYIKVGTSGTGGMGFNIPYTHGEEKPSRVLLSKAAVAGAQTLLIFLMARTPGGPTVVKEVKPTAMIGWKEISYGPIIRRGQTFPLYDCPPEQAVSIREPENLAPEDDRFGVRREGVLEAVYIHTGENGLFATGEFTAITALGQMQFVTPEEIAAVVVRELQGGNTGKDVIAALDGAVMGPTYRAAYLRQAALNRLHQLEQEHGESVAFEILGPPRLSKLLYEAYLLKRVYGRLDLVLEPSPEAMAEALEHEIRTDPLLRQHIISIGLGILLPDGEHLLRGPVLKGERPDQGWVDLTPDNMARWQERIRRLRAVIHEELGGDTSSRHDRNYPASREWNPDDLRIDIGELVGWLFSEEEQGRRGKD